MTITLALDTFSGANFASRAVAWPTATAPVNLDIRCIQEGGVRLAAPTGALMFARSGLGAVGAVLVDEGSTSLPAGCAALLSLDALRALRVDTRFHMEQVPVTAQLRTTDDPAAEAAT